MQAFEHFFGVPEAQRRGRFQRIVSVDLLPPETVQRVGVFHGIGKDAAEMTGDPRPVRFQLSGKCRPAGKAHRTGDLRALRIAGRQPVGLLIVDVLQAVFEAAQKRIGGEQFVAALRTQQAAFDEPRQHGERRADLQGAVASAADELEHLGDEFDFTDAARPELDVVGPILAHHLAANLRVQVAHGVDRAEIQILAVNERADDFLQHLRPVRLVVFARIQNARPDPGITLPFAPLGDQIVFERDE